MKTFKEYLLKISSVLTIATVSITAFLTLIIFMWLVADIPHPIFSPEFLNDFFNHNIKVFDIILSMDYWLELMFKTFMYTSLFITVSIIHFLITKRNLKEFLLKIISIITVAIISVTAAITLIIFTWVIVDIPDQLFSPEFSSNFFNHDVKRNWIVLNLGDWLELMVKIYMFTSLFLTISIIHFIRTKMNDNQRPYVFASLWLVTLSFGYLLFVSINDEMKFESVKNARFQEVIKNLEDIRMAQLAHETVTDSFTNDWDKLVRFIETDSFTITEKIDMRIPDKEYDRLYGTSGEMKDTVIVKFLRNVSVRDSLFGLDNRYKRMMYVPFAQRKDEKFKLETNLIEKEVGSNITYLPAFEVSVKKKIILFDQPENLIKKENNVQSVDGVNGETIKVGSLYEAKTDGNWPKNYFQNKKD